MAVLEQIKKFSVWTAGIIAGAAVFAAGSAPAQAETAYKYYEVAAGDTVYSIAKRYGVDSKELLRVNAGTIVDCRGLKAGSILLVPVVPHSAAAASSGSELSNAPMPSKVSLSDDDSSDSVACSQPVKSAAAPAGNTHVRRSLAGSRGSTARHRNVAVGTDGKVTYIPQYVDPNAVPEEAAAASAGSVKNLLAQARSYMGVPYVWGGTTPAGFDCSGYVQYVYGKVGVNLPRTADVQFNEGRSVALGSEAPGDMVFFETYTAGASHVGIYIGGGQFIHASSSGCVRVSSLDESYFKQRYLGARRVL